MRVVIDSPIKGGSVKVPPSKSVAHRYAICASVSDRPTEIVMDESCDDIEATAGCLGSLGAAVTEDPCGITVSPISRIRKNAVLDCRESGSTLRFLMPFAASLGADAVFSMSGRLPERPISPLDSVMREHGTEIIRKGNTYVCSGRMTGTEYHIDSGISSQYITGIMFALANIGHGTVVLEGKTESNSYIELTCDALRTFGAEVGRHGNVIAVSTDGLKSPGRLEVESDWSGAAFWACAGAVSRDPVTLLNIREGSAQGDRKILDIVRMAGADVTSSGKDITVKRNRLEPVSVDASDIPDLVPAIAAVAAGIPGRSVIYGASRLRLKESDRLATVSSVLNGLGACVEQTDDGLVIEGKKTLTGGCVSSYGDHRIAMCAGIASLFCEGPVIIEGAECVSKSYAAFWDDLGRLGGTVRTEE